jgi:23S rRNA (uridine2552-2'-O)-methyltransferase
MQIRNVKTKLKTAKGRKISSTQWLERQLNDPYVRQSKVDGYRSRAAYKLIQINEKFDLIKPGNLVVDLGSTPGGWSQVSSKILNLDSNQKSRLIALDLNPMDPIHNVDFILGDFTTEDVYNQLENMLGERRPNVIVSDMAASSCGNSKIDHDRIIMLCEMVFDFAFNWLEDSGSVVVKVLRGGTENSLLSKVKEHFQSVKHFKPEASRKDSSEMYLVATGYKKKNN